MADKNNNVEEVLDQTNNNSGENNDSTNNNVDNNSNDNSTGNGTSGNSSNNNSGEKTFTQSQVNSMMSREKKQGRDAAYRELGINPKDKNMIGLIKSFMDSQKTEEQKVEELKSENDAKVAEAERRAIIAEAKAEAMLLGVNKEYIDDVIALAMTKLTDDTDIKSVLEDLKKKYSVWFSDTDSSNSSNNENNVGQRGTGSSVRSDNSSSKGKETNNLGQRLAAKRKSTSSKSSFWN